MVRNKPSKLVECEKCSGKGRIPSTIKENNNNNIIYNVNCSNCNGIGAVPIL